MSTLIKKVREIKKPLPPIFEEIKLLQGEVDEERKDRTERTDTLDTLNKQLDRVSEKRKKSFDEIDRLRKNKQELQDKYYGQMIEFTKYQYLANDIKWMNEVQERLKVRDAERQQRENERKERIERIKKEKEERKQRELDRKQREEERKEREIARRQKELEEMRQTEIDHLAKLNEALEDHSVGTNPLFDQIEQCEFLKRYCQKKVNSPEENQEQIESSDAKKQASGSNELDKALAKGSIQLAPSKESKLAASVFT